MPGTLWGSHKCGPISYYQIPSWTFWSWCLNVELGFSKPLEPSDVLQPHGFWLHHIPCFPAKSWERREGLGTWLSAPAPWWAVWEPNGEYHPGCPLPSLWSLLCPFSVLGGSGMGGQDWLCFIGCIGFSCVIFGIGPGVIIGCQKLDWCRNQRHVVLSFCERRG